ncbi:MAG TPA: NmrA family NAD(P)-binding protein [Verrucomicrobiae bacterium]|nr:NmrA family NAD(P)-binding protein [Verrucomicrobiae bacterium]
MIVITGATGNTGRVAAEALLAKGGKVRVIGRDSKKLHSLTQKGAEAFVGNVEDAASMTKAFEGAKAIYLVIPQSHTVEDLRAYQDRIADSFVSAVAAARVPFVVTLSSIGAQHSEGTGPIVGLHFLEEKLNRIAGLNVLHLRPAQFMENLLMNIQPLRTMGVLPGGAKGDLASPWIATKDIGAYAAPRLAACDFKGVSTQELLGPRDVTMNEIASIIGNAIGKPKLSYTQVPFLMLGPAIASMGIPKKTGDLLIEMMKAGNSGLLNPQEARSQENTTPTTIESFATEVFAPAYAGKTATA